VISFNIQWGNGAGVSVGITNLSFVKLIVWAIFYHNKSEIE